MSENYVVAYPTRISSSRDADPVAVEPGHGLTQRYALQAVQPECRPIDCAPEFGETASQIEFEREATFTEPLPPTPYGVSCEREDRTGTAQ